jgi:hypothetical protein
MVAGSGREWTGVTLSALLTVINKLPLLLRSLKAIRMLCLGSLAVTPFAHVLGIVAAYLTLAELIK